MLYQQAQLLQQEEWRLGIKDNPSGVAIGYV
jgi:hypothetical protein